MDEALPQCRGLGLLHPRTEPVADVLHRRRRDLVGEPQPLDLLLRLQRARADEEGRRVGRLGEGVEPGRRERRGLADHPVGGLRAERQLEADALVVASRRHRRVERSGDRRPRILRVVATDQPDILRPRHAPGILLRGLDRDQHRLALAWEDAGVVPLHSPEVREVEDVVGCADHERVELFLCHERADALQLRVVSWPAHLARLDVLVEAEEVLGSYLSFKATRRS